MTNKSARLKNKQLSSKLHMFVYAWKEGYNE